MIKCQLIQLLSQRQSREKRKISYHDIAKATGVTPSTISRMARDKVTRFDATTLSALCAYFECALGELLVYEEDENKPSN